MNNPLNVFLGLIVSVFIFVGGLLYGQHLAHQGVRNRGYFELNGEAYHCPWSVKATSNQD